MIRTLCVRRLAATAGMLAALPLSAGAEGYRDLYGGYTLSDDVQVNQQFNGETGSYREGVATGATRNLSFPSSGEIGIRAGMWMTNVSWLGVAADISYFSREADGADFNLVPASLLLMLRPPLPAAAPERFQLYGGLGPSVVISDATIDFRPDGTRVSEWSVAGGQLDARLGGAWRMGKTSSLFLEYRFTSVKLEYEEEDCLAWFCFGSDAPTRVVSTTETRLNTQHLYLGLRF